MVVRTRPVQKAIEKRPRRKRKAPEQYAEEAKPTPSIRDLLTKRKPTTLPSTTEDDLPTSAPKDPILEANLYIEQVKRDVNSMTTDAPKPLLLLIGCEEAPLGSAFLPTLAGL